LFALNLVEAVLEVLGLVAHVAFAVEWRECILVDGQAKADRTTCYPLVKQGSCDLLSI
jgi:hypothetical protein